MKKYSFISIITTDDYLPGLLVLAKSLLETKTIYPFLTLVTPNISSKTLETLRKYNIEYKILVDEIGNPTDVNKNHRWFSTYSKLYIFDQIQYDKVVYLDADMIVLRNIDELFEKPHMSATNAGGMLPRKTSWTHINSGLLVIEPSKEVFNDMRSKIGVIEKTQSGGTIERPAFGSDQDFLNAYYPEWPNKKELHLDHKYNIFHYHLDEYHNLFGYSINEGRLPISIIHYASYMKPWGLDVKTEKDLQEDPNKSLELKAIRLWIDTYNRIKVDN